MKNFPRPTRKNTFVIIFFQNESFFSLRQEKINAQQGKQNPRAQDHAKSRKDQCPIKQTKVKEKLKKKKEKS